MSYNRHQEAWERKKAYLIRSLFHDISRPSTILEEGESSPDRETRPYSPLPPLIVEIVPRKQKEPEEDYKKLERKIKKMYRRLFIEDRSDISNISDTDVSLNNSMDLDDAEIIADFDASEKTKLSTGTERIKLVEYSDSDRSERASDDDYEQDIHTNSERRTEFYVSRERNSHTGNISDMAKSQNSGSHKEFSRTQSTETKSSSEEYRQFTFEADVHREHNSSMKIVPALILENVPGEDKAVDNIEDIANRDKNIADDRRSDISNTRESGINKEPFRIQSTQTESSSDAAKSQNSGTNKKFFRTQSTQTDSKSEANSDTFKSQDSSSNTELSRRESPETKSSSEGYRQVTFESNVHREHNSSVKAVPPLICDSVPKRSTGVDQLEDTANQDENIVSDANHNAAIANEHVEVMRTPRPHQSYGSVQNEPSEEEHNESISIRNRNKRSLEQCTESDNSGSDNVNNIDNPENPFDNNDFENTFLGRKCSLSLSPPSKRIRRQDAQVQDVSGQEQSNQIDVGNIFAGVPRIFYLCSSSNHT